MKNSLYIKTEQIFLKLQPVFLNKSLDKDLKDQLRRASTSIILNIAEGSGKFAKNDKKNFYIIARGSVNECVAILRILKLQNLVDEKLYNDLYHDYLEIGKMLSGLIGSILERK